MLWFVYNHMWSVAVLSIYHITATIFPRLQSLRTRRSKQPLLSSRRTFIRSTNGWSMTRLCLLGYFLARQVGRWLIIIHDSQRPRLHSRIHSYPGHVWMGRDSEEVTHLGRDSDAKNTLTCRKKVESDCVNEWTDRETDKRTEGPKCARNWKDAASRALHSSFCPLSRDPRQDYPLDSGILLVYVARLRLQYVSMFSQYVQYVVHLLCSDRR